MASSDNTTKSSGSHNKKPSVVRKLASAFGEVVQNISAVTSHFTKDDEPEEPLNISETSYLHQVVPGVRSSVIAQAVAPPTSTPPSIPVLSPRNYTPDSNESQDTPSFTSSVKSQSPSINTPTTQPETEPQPLVLPPTQLPSIKLTSSNIQTKSMSESSSSKAASAAAATARVATLVQEEKTSFNHDAANGQFTGVSIGYTANMVVSGLTLSDVQAKLLNALGEVNGQDAYSSESASMGRLSVNEYLVLPTGYVPPEVKDSDVGSKEVAGEFLIKDLADIYALNKAAAPAGEDAIKFGIARVEAVKRGWVSRPAQREIRFAARPADSLALFANDLSNHAEYIATASKVSWLVPLAAEYVFRTLGHHYITEQSSMYEDKYRRVFLAALEPGVHGFMRAATMYHAAFHWIGPKRIRDVVVSQAGGTRIPDAIKIRISAAPAGTAVITTTAAVLDSMKSSGFYDEMKKSSGEDLDAIIALTQTIRSNPTKYHKTPSAYGMPSLTQAETTGVDTIRALAQRFAPVAQGYIDGVLKQAALGQAMALKKHADNNPIRRRVTANFFRTIARQPVKTLSGLFSTSLTISAPSK